MNLCRDNDLNKNKSNKRSHFDYLAQQSGKQHESGTFPRSFTYKSKGNKGPKEPEIDDVDFNVGVVGVLVCLCVCVSA